jgi:hypothetical protein
MPRLYLSKILGFLTLAGLALFIVDQLMYCFNRAYPTSFIPLCAALSILAGFPGASDNFCRTASNLCAALSILAGLPWAHMPGWRGLKAAYLGLVGLPIGGFAGWYLGEALPPSGPGSLDIKIKMIVGGFWVGAILLCGLGIWWGLRFHRPGARKG